MSASQNGHVEVVDKLLQHGARVDLQAEVCFTFQSSSYILYIRKTMLSKRDFCILVRIHMESVHWQWHLCTVMWRW